MGSWGRDAKTSKVLQAGNDVVKDKNKNNTNDCGKNYN
jgi:hypothetical protein